MEGYMVEASENYETQHGVPFPSIDGTVHEGVLYDLIENLISA